MDANSPTDHRNEALAILALRLGLAWFLAVWGINKILAPVQYQKIWGYFHGIEIGPSMPYIMGAAQVVICLAIAIGLWRIVTYALGFVMHAVTIAVILPGLLAPFVIEDGFPVNRNQSIALAALAAFAALWLLRHRDHWSKDAWLRRRKEVPPEAS